MYKPGDVITATVSAIKPYGAFVKVDEDDSGLIHISEISDHYVNNVARYVAVGEKIICKVIDVNENGQYKLSLKAVRTHRNLNRYRYGKGRSIGKIGFSSLKEALPGWIDEAKERIQYLK